MKASVCSLMTTKVGLFKQGKDFEVCQWLFHINLILVFTL